MNLTFDCYAFQIEFRSEVSQFEISQHIFEGRLARAVENCVRINGSYITNLFVAAAYEEDERLIGDIPSFVSVYMYETAEKQNGVVKLEGVRSVGIAQFEP